MPNTKVEKVVVQTRTITKSVPQRETFPHLFNFELKKILEYSNKLLNPEHQIFYLQYILKHFLVTPDFIQNSETRKNFKKEINQKIELLSKKTNKKIKSNKCLKFLFDNDFEKRCSKQYNFKEKYSLSVMKNVFNCKMDLFSKSDYFKEIYEELTQDIKIINSQIGSFENESNESYTILFYVDISKYLIEVRNNLRKEIDSLEKLKQNKFMSKILNSETTNAKKTSSSNRSSKIKWFGGESTLTYLIEKLKEKKWVTEHETFSIFKDHFIKKDGSEFNFHQSKQNYERKETEHFSEKGKPKISKEIDILIQEASNKENS